MSGRTETSVEARPFGVVGHAQAQRYAISNNVGECVAAPSCHNGLLHAAGSRIVRKCRVASEVCIATRVVDAWPRVRALRRGSSSIPVASVSGWSSGGDCRWGSEPKGRVGGTNRRGP
jgi:hypothetical protein